MRLQLNDNDTEKFYQESYRRRRVRPFRVSVIYKFGDSNFKLFKRNGGRDGMEEGGYGM